MNNKNHVMRKLSAIEIMRLGAGEMGCSLDDVALAIDRLEQSGLIIKIGKDADDERKDCECEGSCAEYKVAPFFLLLYSMFAQDKQPIFGD
jgi:hypothetical protein